jgi:hypothetical protein
VGGDVREFALQRLDLGDDVEGVHLLGVSGDPAQAAALRRADLDRQARLEACEDALER